MLYTIGHSNYDIQHFIELLMHHRIEIIVDVRSSPYSKYCPQFNRDDLKKSLESSGIKYLFLGEQLGARPDNPSCYINGEVSFELLSESDSFKEGINRVREGLSKGYKISLMCSEKEPIDCHRTILVSRALYNCGIEISHIVSKDLVISHQDIENQLLVKYKLNEPDFFFSEQDRLLQAYKKQEYRICFKSEQDHAEAR